MHISLRAVDKLSISNLPHFNDLKKMKFVDTISINRINNDDIFNLKFSNYYQIPTFELLLEILSPIMKDKKKYLY